MFANGHGSQAGLAIPWLILAINISAVCGLRRQAGHSKTVVAFLLCLFWCNTFRWLRKELLTFITFTQSHFGNNRCPFHPCLWRKNVLSRPLRTWVAPARRVERLQMTTSPCPGLRLVYVLSFVSGMSLGQNEAFQMHLALSNAFWSAAFLVYGVGLEVDFSSSPWQWQIGAGFAFLRLRSHTQTWALRVGSFRLGLPGRWVLFGFTSLVAQGVPCLAFVWHDFLLFQCAVLVNRLKRQSWFSRLVLQ